MLDRSDSTPDYAHLFHAGNALAELAKAANEMTVAPSVVRVNLLTNRCQPLLTELRELNRDHFKADEVITRAIDEYETGLQKLAALGNGQIIEDHRDGTGKCSVCESKIHAVNPMPGIPGHDRDLVVFCGVCSDCYASAHKTLASFAGFGLDMI